MRLQSHRRNLLSNLSASLSGPRAMKPLRSRRIRWRLRTGAVLSVIGARRLVLTARTRWQPVFLVAGALFMVIGVMLGSTVAFVSGMLVVGSAAGGTGLRSPTAAMVRTWAWLYKSDPQD